jgi:hypothetical protein
MGYMGYSALRGEVRSAYKIFGPKALNGNYMLDI